MAERTCEVPDCGARHYARGRCKPCYRKAYYAANRDRERAQMAEWRRSNREHDRQRWADYYARQRERLNAAARAYYHRHREQAVANAVAYRRANPGISERWRKNNPE